MEKVLLNELIGVNERVFKRLERGGLYCFFYYIVLVFGNLLNFVKFYVIL